MATGVSLLTQRNDGDGDATYAAGMSDSCPLQSALPLGLFRMTNALGSTEAARKAIAQSLMGVSVLVARAFSVPPTARRQVHFAGKSEVHVEWITTGSAGGVLVGIGIGVFFQLQLRAQSGPEVGDRSLLPRARTCGELLPQLSPV